MYELEKALEQALRDALRREAAPEGFAERVLARAFPVRPETHERRGWRRTSAFRWSAAAALVVVLLAGTALIHRQYVIRGERARDQLMLALRITGSKLHLVQQQLAQIDRDGGNQ